MSFVIISFFSVPTPPICFLFWWIFLFWTFTQRIICSLFWLISFTQYDVVDNLTLLWLTLLSGSISFFKWQSKTLLHKYFILFIYPSVEEHLDGTLLFKFLLLIMCLCVVLSMFKRVSWRLEEGIGFCENVGTGSCETLDVGAGNWTQVSWRSIQCS